MTIRTMTNFDRRSITAICFSLYLWSAFICAFHQVEAGRNTVAMTGHGRRQQQQEHHLSHQQERRPQRRTVGNDRRIEITNNSGKKLVVEWIDPITGDIVTLQPSFAPGSSTIFNSFVNHTFAVHEAHSACVENGEREDHGGDNDSAKIRNHDAKECNIRFITIHDDSAININRDLHISTSHPTAVDTVGAPVNNKIDDFQDDDDNVNIHDLQKHQHPHPDDFASRCRQEAVREIASGREEHKILDDLAECLANGASQLFQIANDEIAFEEKIRLGLSADIENITCADPSKVMSTPIDVRAWTYRNETTRTVNVMHDRQHSQIHVLENFISPEECDAITAAAKPNLHRGTVADGRGGHKLSDHRKAWQAGVKVPWTKEHDGNLIARVVRRIYEYTNHALGYNLTVDGQEDLMSIQYFGIGQNSTESPDQYRPHCDGNCDGLPHKTGGRVATMVMYCDVPDLGGATNFQNANVFVKPKIHAAAFFSYMDPITHKMEPGFTSHSGCPVIEGTKRIAVHWMRIGVDKQNPWDSFNTLTIKKEDEEDC